DLKVQKWIETIDNLKLPNWDELPTIGLYSEQVLTYANEHLNSIFLSTKHEDYEITSSMINNYVKHKIMLPPVKKKYYNAHIEFIITITVLKQVGRLIDVHKGITNLRNKLGKVDAYNIFIKFLELSLKAAANELKGTPDVTFYTNPVSLDLLPLKT